MFPTSQEQRVLLGVPEKFLLHAYGTKQFGGNSNGPAF